jgi:hypothetical protein
LRNAWVIPLLLIVVISWITRPSFRSAANRDQCPVLPSRLQFCINRL